MTGLWLLEIGGLKVGYIGLLEYDCGNGLFAQGKLKFPEIDR